jgi:hypothetical protein
MIKKLSVVLGGVVFIFLLWALPVAAQRDTAAPSAQLVPDAAPTQVVFALLSGDVAWLDNNNACASPSQGPRALWLGLTVTNDAAEILTGVVAQLSGFPSPYYALTTDPVRYVGNLAPGESYYGYWYVDYSGACPNPFNRTDQYTLTVTANNLTGPARYTGSLTTQKANDVGGGDIITASQGSGIAIGQIFTQVVQYQLSKATAVLIQPAGDSGFEDTCFRLVDVKVTQSSVAGIPVGTSHQLYFPDASPRNKNQLTVEYFWQAQCQADSTAKPWMSLGTSAPGKYSNKYGVYFTTFPTASLSLNITSAVTPVRLTAPGTVMYTVRFANTFSQPVELNTITVTLASGLSFDSFVATESDVLPDNSSLYPLPGQPGTLVWQGKPGVSYSVPAATAGGPGTLELVFKVNVPGIDGMYTQHARGQAGKLNVGVTSDDIIVDIPTAVTLSTFEATPQGEAILVTWETASELDNVGFNLYRSTAAAGPYTLLNGALIPPQNPGMVLGGVYEWLDADVQPGATYFYKLEDIDVKGVSTFHGPISTSIVTAPTAVRLRSVSARSAITPLALGLTMLLGLVAVYRQRRLGSI